MLGSRTMTRLAAVPVLQGGLEMRRGFEVLLVQVLVTRLANVHPGVFGGFVAGRRRDGLLLLAAGTCWSSQEQQQNCRYSLSRELFVQFADRHSRTPRLCYSCFSVQRNYRRTPLSVEKIRTIRGFSRIQQSPWPAHR